MTLEQWLMAFVALACLTAALMWRAWRQRRQLARQRRRRVLDELDEIGVERVEAQRCAAGGDGAGELGAADVLAGRDGIARKGTSFFVDPESPARWPTSADDLILLRFERRGVRHELRCRVAGRTRRPPRARRGAGRRRTLLRLTPAGVVVKRERRDMMRFFVGEGHQSKPRGTMDARRFVGLRAWLRETDLALGDEVRLPLQLAMGDVTLSAETADRDVAESPATPAPDREGLRLSAGGAEESDGFEVGVIDFSGTGLRVQAPLAAVLPWLRLAGDEDPSDVLDRLADRALLVAVRVHLDFPSRVEDLEPVVPPRTWVLAEVARVSLLEAEGGDDEPYLRLGLAFLYQILEADTLTDTPRRWERLQDQGEADDFVTIHSALNQAMAQMQSTAPTP